MGRSALRSRREGGQAAVEFILALVWIIFLVSLLFQALHFERDVFNKTGELRYRLLKRIQQNAQNIEGRTVQETILGKPLGELTTYRIPGQDVDLTLRYGPKTVYGFGGTKRYFPGGDGAQTAIYVGMVGWLAKDHYQDSAGTFVGELKKNLAF